MGIGVTGMPPSRAAPPAVRGSAARSGAGSRTSVGSFAPATGQSAGVRGSGVRGEPQETRWSRSPPKPVWREVSACQAEAGSAAAGSSSKKTGPVSSTVGTGAGAWAWAGTCAGAWTCASWN